MIAAYGFDEAAGAAATDFMRRHDGDDHAAPPASADGRCGGALSFDGTDDWVTVAASSELDLTSGMTLEAWVKPSALATWSSVV